jgi:hypothetical protein
MPDEVRTFMVEDAHIINLNFSGKEKMYNDKGRRNFCVILEDDIAEEMAREGWNVKYTKIREEGDIPRPFLPVDIRFDIRPPRIVLITDTTRTQLNEDSVEVLDWADIRTVDLIARGSPWGNPDGKSGIKAYLQTMFVTIEEDELERKYAINENPPT